MLVKQQLQKSTLVEPLLDMMNDGSLHVTGREKSEERLPRLHSMTIKQISDKYSENTRWLPTEL